MVYKGHGKDEREKTGKFRSRPAESTYTMTTNRSTRFCDNMTERELEVRTVMFKNTRQYKIESSKRSISIFCVRCLSQNVALKHKS